MQRRAGAGGDGRRPRVERNVALVPAGALTLDADAAPAVASGAPEHRLRAPSSPGYCQRSPPPRPSPPFSPLLSPSLWITDPLQ